MFIKSAFTNHLFHKNFETFVPKFEEYLQQFINNLVRITNELLFLAFEKQGEF